MSSVGLEVPTLHRLELAQSPVHRRALPTELSRRRNHAPMPRGPRLLLRRRATELAVAGTDLEGWSGAAQEADKTLCF